MAKVVTHEASNDEYSLYRQAFVVDGVEDFAVGVSSS